MEDLDDQLVQTFQIQGKLRKGAQASPGGPFEQDDNVSSDPIKLSNEKKDDQHADDGDWIDMDSPENQE